MAEIIVDHFEDMIETRKTALQSEGSGMSKDTLKGRFLLQWAF
jgi:hypothetical protein